METLLDRVGNTPLLRLKNLERKYGVKGELYAKAELFNPTGSVKDRVAKAMIADAERRGILPPRGTIVEPTSGNTGIALAAFSALKGYRCLLVMPDSMSMERRRLLAMYGAKLVLTPGEEGMRGAVKRARELAEERGAYLPMQFENPVNPVAHYATTGPEIAAQCGGVAAFVAGVGTGGTLTGVGRSLKEQDPSVKIVAVEPARSPVLSGGKAGRHAIEGIGAGFVPPLFDPALCDEIIAVGDGEALSRARELAMAEGIFAGISSGAAVHAALLVAGRESFRGKRVVVLLPDSGDRYLSRFSGEGEI